MPPISRFIYNNKNKRLHVLSWPLQKQNAPTCLLLHGFSNNAWIWNSLAQQLSEHFQVYALDFRGHGDSDWDDDLDYSHADFEHDLYYCLESLSLHNVHLVGHSLGARVAAQYIEHNSSSLQQIKSLTVIDSGPEVNPVASKKIRRDIENIPHIYSSPEDYLGLIKNIYLFAESAEIDNLVTHDLKKKSDSQWQLKFDQRMIEVLWSKDPSTYKTLNENLWKSFSAIQQPCLILRGKISAVLKQSTADAMKSRMHNVELINIPRAGHAVMTDNPKAATEAVLNFLLKN